MVNERMLTGRIWLSVTYVPERLLPRSNNTAHDPRIYDRVKK